ncbi:MAG: helix-turn-helix domain-containing protein [Legionellales bacterium]|nr:helix-turn-helix domain-containing protein [Legionellales bacterium]
MEKVDLLRQFAQRLRETMIAAGFNSHRSPSGVNIKKLSEISGHSLQICRKYLRGQTIPEPLKLTEIARMLHVSPGWLLFGDSHHDASAETNQLSISKSLLHYLLSQASPLYHSTHSGESITDFLVELTQNVSQMNAKEEQSKQIIDLALSSIRHFG